MKEIALLVLSLIAILAVSGCTQPTGQAITTTKEQVQTVESIKSSALNVSFGELMRNIENYKEKIVYYRGEVVQVSENYGDNYVLRVSVTYNEYGFWTDTIWVNYHGSRVLEKDIIDVWGNVKGLKTYEAILGNSVTVPEIDAINLVVVFKAELRKECGKTGNICCVNDECEYGNTCVNNSCQECGGENQIPCENTECDYGYELINGNCVTECSYGEIRIDNVCQKCGRDNQIPCSDGCDYGYELISVKCVSECGYSQIRINGICTDCGGLNEPCCSNSECDYSKVCKNNVCVNCGDEAGQPCCLGEYKCLSFPTTTCVNDACQYCGRTGEICCEGNKCNSGQICKNGVCEECGSVSQQCCGPENYYICIIGSCTNNVCVY